VDAKQLLLFDADGPVRRTVAEQLTGFGFSVTATASESDAVAGARAFDLLIVTGLPAGGDMRTLCDTWSSAGAAVLVLCEDDEMAAAVEQAGALALTKPVRLADLARVVRDALRVNLAPDLEIGALRFHPPTRELIGPDAPPVRLTEKEAAILCHLRRAEGYAVPRDALLAEIWGYANVVATHTLETHVYRLRRKLASVTPTGPRLVSDGNGYRLTLSGAPDE